MPSLATFTSEGNSDAEVIAETVSAERVMVTLPV